MTWRLQDSKAGVDLNSQLGIHDVTPYFARQRFNVGIEVLRYCHMYLITVYLICCFVALSAICGAHKTCDMTRTGCLDPILLSCAFLTVVHYS